MSDAALAEDPAEAARAIRQRHRAMWALGDYPRVATQLIPDLGRRLVEACAVGSGHRVLDVAAGSGNVAIPAARTGARVVACDLTPELLEAGREQARRLGVALEWREADAAALPFGDGEFDVVMSCVGVMFAADQQRCADELLRVCRPGGTVGLISWTPEGFIGEMLATMKPYTPPPPPGWQSPTRWGTDEHLRALFGDGIDDLATCRESVVVDRFATPEEFRDYIKEGYGPTVAAYRAIGHDPELVAGLDRDLADLARRYDRGVGATTLHWEYLLATAGRREEIGRR